MPAEEAISLVFFVLGAERDENAGDNGAGRSLVSVGLTSCEVKNCRAKRGTFARMLVPSFVQAHFLGESGLLRVKTIESKQCGGVSGAK